MSDLKLYTFDQTVKFQSVDTARLMEGYLTQPAVSGLELIVGKVVKFLLTELGSDLFDPAYGSTWVGMAQVSGSYLPRLRVTINSDLQRCVAYITEQEKSLPPSTERLQSVTFEGFKKDSSTGVEVILLSIRVRTTQNNIAIFSIGQ